MTTRLFEVLANRLCDRGVDTVFGVLGSNMFMVDALVNKFGCTYVAAAHEAGALAMASGYSQVASCLGVAVVARGPGLTNGITALVDASRGRVPMLVIVGDAPADQPANLQRINQRELVSAAECGFVAVPTPRRALVELETAALRAMVERRPIVLSVPSDFEWHEIEDDSLSHRQPLQKWSQGQPRRTGSPDEAAIRRAVGLMVTKRRPVILAGKGAVTPQAGAALRTLARSLGAPLVTTLKAKDLFHGDPYELGICGVTSTAQTLDVVQRSDCLLVFGASLNEWTTCSDGLIHGTRMIRCDQDELSLASMAREDAPILGDAGVVADVLVGRLAELEHVPSAWSSTVELVTPAPRDPSNVDPPSDADRLRVASVLGRLDSLIGNKRSLVTDGGTATRTAWTTVQVDHPSHFVFTLNFGAIGLGMGVAIGAWSADRDRETVLVCGDGGFVMGGIAEFNTAVRAGANLVVVVLNNGCYGSEAAHFAERSVDPALTHFHWPDFAPVARALGGAGVTVRSPRDVDEMARAIQTGERPLLIDVQLAQGQTT